MINLKAKIKRMGIYDVIANVTEFRKNIGRYI